MTAKAPRKPKTSLAPMKMSDIARLAGVSASTVSRALAGHPALPEATRASIQKLAAEHGYAINQSARSLRQRQTRTIGIAIPLGHETQQMISDPFFLQLFGHFADEISSRSYDVLLSRNPAPDPDWLARLAQSHRADGFIVVGQSNQHEMLNAASRNYMPLVVWGAHLPGQHYCSVGSDNEGGGRIAVEHLLRSGRRRIVFLGATDLPEISMRLAGYRAALASAGVSFDERLVIQAHFTGETAFAAVQDLLKRRVRFDAIFAASDLIALSALRALEEGGKSCPEDVAVVGFDDLDIAEHSRPALTTVRQDLARGARTLVEFLFRRIEGEETPSATLPVELVLRASAP
jgi:DNA-binding LacI/PurR family transcriptional regulator